MRASKVTAIRIKQFLSASLFSIGLLSSMSFAASPPSESTVTTTFTEGQHYEKLKKPHSMPANKPVQVVEFFNYGCPHCFHLEGHVEKWQGKKRADVNFVRVPAFWNPYFSNLAQAYYTAEVLKPGDSKIHQAIYDAIHVKNNPLKSLDQMKTFFADQGVSEKEFEDTFNSYAVQQKMKRGDTLFRDYELRSVPIFVINGTYVTNVTMAGSEEQVFKVIEHLVDEVVKQRPKNAVSTPSSSPTP